MIDVAPCSAPRKYSSTKISTPAKTGPGSASRTETRAGKGTEMGAGETRLTGYLLGLTRPARRDHDGGGSDSRKPTLVSRYCRSQWRDRAGLTPASSTIDPVRVGTASKPGQSPRVPLRIIFTR